MKHFVAMVAIVSLCTLNAGKRKQEQFDHDIPRVTKRQRSESPVKVMNMADLELLAMERANRADGINQFVDTFNNYTVYHTPGDQEFPKNYLDLLKLHAETVLSWKDIETDNPKITALFNAAKLKTLSAEKSLLAQLRKRSSNDALLNRLQLHIVQESMKALNQWEAI